MTREFIRAEGASPQRETLRCALPLLASRDERTCCMADDPIAAAAKAGAREGLERRLGTGGSACLNLDVVQGGAQARIARPESRAAIVAERTGKGVSIFCQKIVVALTRKLWLSHIIEIMSYAVSISRRRMPSVTRLGILRTLGVSALALTPSIVVAAPLSSIPYSDIGQQNTASYTFTATATGAVNAYFALPTNALYAEAVELVDNGVPTNNFVLINHSSTPGQEVLLGNVTQGDQLSFNLLVYTSGTYGSGPSYTLSSTASQNLKANGGVDTSGNGQHIYSTSYTQGSGLVSSIPNGTYVAFEDLLAPGADFNYADESYVFTNVAESSDVPEPASVSLLASAFAAAAFTVRRRILR
jgi:hypothetical protein